MIARLLVQRRRARAAAAKLRAAAELTDTSLPGDGCFTDNVSEVDADIDLTTPVAMAVPVALTGPRMEVAQARPSHTLGRGWGSANASQVTAGAGYHIHY